MPARKKNPSKIPVSPAWVRRETERRLSRRSGGQSGGADQRGTDHSSPISLPSLSQPSSLQTSPAPALQSQEFGRIGDFIYSNEGTPIGSEISLLGWVGGGMVVTNRTYWYCSNHWEIFSDLVSWIKHFEILLTRNWRFHVHEIEDFMYMKSYELCW